MGRGPPRLKGDATRVRILHGGKPTWQRALWMWAVDHKKNITSAHLVCGKIRYFVFVAILALGVLPMAVSLHKPQLVQGVVQRGACLDSSGRR